MQQNGSDFSVAILGPGAVGGFLASMLWRAGISVTCVARESTADLITREGIHFDSVRYGSFTAFPKAVPQLDCRPDLLFIATKAFHLPDAIGRIPVDLIADTTVVPLLNGFDHMDFLRGILGPHLAAGSIYIQTKYLSANRLQHTSPFDFIEWASDRDVPAERLAMFREKLALAGIKVTQQPSEAHVLFRKNVRLCALALTTTAFDQELGNIRASADMRPYLEGCVREASAVACAEGILLDPDTQLAAFDDMPADLGSSMQRDLAAGRDIEVDAIAGALVRRAARHGLTCPVVQELIHMIQEKKKALHSGETAAVRQS